MAIVYNWVIYKMDEVSQEGLLLDVVVTVYWTRNASTEANGITYSTNLSGAMACTTPSPTDFTAYPDLTFEQVCGWLDAGVDVPALDSKLDTLLGNLINPPVVSLPLPWVPTPSPDTSGTSGTSGTDGTSGTSGI
jgi:hypothetical protein